MPYTWSVFQLSVPRNSLKKFYPNKNSLRTLPTLCVDSSGALHLRCSSSEQYLRTVSFDSHRRKNFREHIQRPVLTIVVLCTYDVPPHKKSPCSARREWLTSQRDNTGSDSRYGGTLVLDGTLHGGNNTAGACSAGHLPDSGFQQ